MSGRRASPRFSSQGVAGLHAIDKVRLSAPKYVIQRLEHIEARLNIRSAILLQQAIALRRSRDQAGSDSSSLKVGAPYEGRPVCILI